MDILKDYGPSIAALIVGYVVSAYRARAIKMVSLESRVLVIETEMRAIKESLERIEKAVAHAD